MKQLDKLEFDKGGIGMKCPYCNNEMKKGFIQCRHGLNWTPKQQWTPVLASLAEGAVPIGMDDKLMPNSKAVAYNCFDCQAIIIPYGMSKDK